MNLNIGNLNFTARYLVATKYPIDGKKSAKSESDKLHQDQRKIALQAKDYLQSPKAQKYIWYLPCDTFVNLHIDATGEDTANNPYVSFYTNSKSEQINISRELGKTGDKLELSLDDEGKLETEKIDNWFLDLIEFYYTQK